MVRSQATERWERLRNGKRGDDIPRVSPVYGWKRRNRGAETRKDRLCVLDSWPNRAKVLPEETEVEDEVECERVRIFAALFPDSFQFQYWIGGLGGGTGG